MTGSPRDDIEQSDDLTRAGRVTHTPGRGARPLQGFMELSNQRAIPGFECTANLVGDFAHGTFSFSPLVIRGDIEAGLKVFRACARTSRLDGTGHLTHGFQMTV